MTGFSKYTRTAKPRTQSAEQVVLQVIKTCGGFQIDHRRMNCWDKTAFKMLKAGKLKRQSPDARGRSWVVLP